MQSMTQADRKHRYPSLPISRAKFLASVYLASVWISAIGMTMAPLHAEEKNAGLMQWSFTYHNTNVPVAVWYPSSETPTQINAGPFTLIAASNAALPERPHPLLILSHGTGGSNIAHHPIAEALATAGFVVAALTHPGDNYQDRSLVTDDRYFEERPRQLAALLKAITHDKKLGASVDQTRIGAIGHSAGGYAVAIMAGATPNRDELIEHCNRVNDDPSCNYRDPTLGVSSPTGTQFSLPENTSPENSSDSVFVNNPPIRSIALLAPLGSVIDVKSRFDQKLSLKVVTAEVDRILPHQYHRARFEQIAPHGTFREAPGAGHFSFIAPINEPWQQQLGEVAIDPEGFDRQAFNDELGLELVEWFNTTLPSDTE